MSLSGNLKTMELAEILQWVSQSSKTGALRISGALGDRQIYFDRGRIIATGSSDPKEQLGHFLVSHGYLSEEQLVKAIQLQESSGMLLGKILVTNGFLSEAELGELLLAKARESIFAIFAWPEGDFRFVEQETLEQGLIPMNLEVAAIVLQGMERLDDWRRIRAAISSAQCVPVKLGELDTSALGGGEQQVLDLVNDDRTIEEICVETHSSEYFVSRAIYEAMQAGTMKVVRPRIVEVEPPSEALTAVEAETLIDVASSCIGRGELARALRHLRAARHLDPESEMTQAAIRSAEDRMKTLMKEEGMSLKAVPRVSIEPGEIQNLHLSPEEGFVLSRIDGNYDLESILKISPMPPLEAQIVFRKLLRAGHIALDQGGR